MVNESLVTRARNNLMAKMMTNEKATHFMFIDADIRFQPEAILMMLSADKDVIGGLYPKKALPIQYVINVQPGTQIINDWSLKGCGANTTGLFSFTGGKSYAVDAWFYEWTGGACSSLNYKPLGSSSYSVVPGSMFTQDAVAEWVKDPALKAVLDAKTVLYVQAVSVELQADVVYTNACDSYDDANLTYGYLGADLSLKRNILQGLESVMGEAEIAWQTASDDKVYADANLLDLKIQYAATFDAIEQATVKVDGLEAQLLQAKQDLVNIPKPSAQEKRRSKKIVVKYFADSAYLARQRFVIDLK
jgi:hypothetical protein